MAAPRVAARLRVVLMTAVFTTTSFFVSLAPIPTSVPLPDGLRPATADASFCATNPTFTGYLSTTTSASPPMLSRTTTGAFYAYISKVDTTWSCDAYYRYSGVAWNTTSTTGGFDWGNLINSTTVPCNYVVNSTNFVKANTSTTACPSTDADRALYAALHSGSGVVFEHVYQNDPIHDSIGDFAFSHSDCGSYYGGEVHVWGQNFAGANVANRPGSNCDPFTNDGTGTPQVIYVDATAPAVAFDLPAAGGPVVVPSAFYTVQFDATDAVAGFGGANGWTLQRQVGTWDGSACIGFAPDGAPVTGTTNAANQLSGQSLLVGKCYQWILDATDQNANSPAAITSGSIRTDTSKVLGSQGHFRAESWDLGAGDSLDVNPGSGNVVISHPIVNLPIRGSSTSVGLAYNSQDASNVGFGPGWRLNVQRRLALNADGSVTFTDGDGSRHTFQNPVPVGTVTTYTRPASLYGTLVKDTSQTIEFTLTYRDKSRDTFDIMGSEGLLTRAEDRFGNGVTVAYVSGTNRISTITDTAGSRTIDFAYDGSNRLTSITDWAYVSGGVVQTGATGSRRTTRFFYDAGSNLSGWGDPLYTSGSCGSLVSHLTCLTMTSGLVTAIGKTQTYETISGSPLALGSSQRLIGTQITYAGTDVTAVKDAEQVNAGTAGTAFNHPGVGQTKVVRPGTPTSETTYTLASVSDALGRINSVKRKLGASQIEQLTAYDATYPIEPASVTENNGALLSTPARTTSWTYVASSLGLISRTTEPLTASTNRTTDYTYNSNNDVTQKIVALDGSGTTRTITRYCYDTGCTTSGASTLTMSKQIDNYIDGTVGNGAANVEDVTTSFMYDTSCASGTTCGQLVRETRLNYNAAGSLLDSAATGQTYDALGNLTSDIANYISGTVSNPGDDITPNATTNARTDLTTAFTFDTAGNPVSSADPRRAIETAKGTCLYQDDYVSHQAFDALGEVISNRQPTTPDMTCPTTPGLTTTSMVDELGGIRQSTDPGGVVSGTEADRLDHGTRTMEDTDGVGSTAAAVTSTSTFDAGGRVMTTKDRLQSAVGSTLGSTSSTYDELGRNTDITEAYLSSPDVASVSHRVFDALDRQIAETAGSGGASAQTTTTTYDLGGRAISVDDEFTCTSTTYDYRGAPTQVTEGRDTGTCANGTRTTTITSDALSRVTLRAVTAGTGIGDQPENNTFDAAGDILQKSGTQGGVTTSSLYTVNPLGQVIVETRTDGSTSKTNYDAAGTATDRCYWKPSDTVGACLPADTASWTNPPTQAGTSGSDARNQRIKLTSRLGSSSTVATTTYDPNHNYQISSFYLPTASGKEAQDLYGYDTRHRLATITHQLCTISTGHACSATSSTGSSAYGYDDNDNRTTVTESSTSGAATTSNYCYDALNRLIADKTSASCATPSSADNVYTYDDSGNRLSAGAPTGVPIHGSRTFTYGADGQLDSCATPACTITYDATGRSATITDNGVAWTFVYDADGKLISACKSTACTGSIDRVDYLYDGSGHRTQIKETTSGGTVTTTDLRYEGETIVQELTGGALSRTYATDDTGRIVEVCDPDCSSGTIYLVVFNGHGDATGLWRKNPDGTLTLANSYAYSTWGSPTTTVASGFSDLKFRFLYVGSSDVQWDNSFGLGLIYMHARHYDPAFGRFIQPDPSGVEPNLYAYATDNPATKLDPDGCRPGRFNEFMKYGCRVLADIISGVYRILDTKFDDLATNRQRLPRYGLRRSIESHLERIWGEQAKLRRALEAWDSNDCDDPPPGAPRYRIPRDSWKMATRLPRLKVYVTGGTSASSGKMADDVIKIVIVAGAAFAVGTGIGWVSIRMGVGMGRPALRK